MGKKTIGIKIELKLNQQIVNKTLPITKIFYPGYLLLFLFDNITSHSVYTKDVL